MMLADGITILGSCTQKPQLHINQSMILVEGNLDRCYIMFSGTNFSIDGHPYFSFSPLCWKAALVVLIFYIFFSNIYWLKGMFSQVQIIANLKWQAELLLSISGPQSVYSYSSKNMKQKQIFAVHCSHSGRKTA
jgi:hypothetical protein